MTKSYNKMEKEMRFIVTTNQYNDIRNRLNEKREVLQEGTSLLEVTTMYDNPNPQLTFYSKAVDGRLRLRTSTNGKEELFRNSEDINPKSLITWKQRVPEHADAVLRTEREIEVKFDASENESVEAILTHVLSCPRISSYERYRDTLYYRNLELSLDQFPYGYVIELELKDSSDESYLEELIQMLNLDQYFLSKYSCDDMYRLLCSYSGIEANTDILFSDDNMPFIDDHYEVLKKDLSTI